MQVVMKCFLLNPEKIFAQLHLGHLAKTHFNSQKNDVTESKTRLL